jgi:hypothetical protein
MMVLANPNTVQAEQKIEFHHPGKKEKKLIYKIFMADNIYKEELINKYDYGHFDIGDVDIAYVNLDNARQPEIVTKVENWHSGSAGSLFEIWKNDNGTWKNILGDFLGDKDYFYVTDHKVNGFSVIRLPGDKNERIYDGESYDCPKCPERG